MSPVIRRASMSDLPGICAIEDGSFPAPYPRLLLERLLEYCEDSFLVAANSDDDLVGYCVCSIEDRSAHLISIAVHPNYRRRGFATALLKELITHMAEMGINELRLEVGVNNTDAIFLYSKNGFDKLDIVPNYYSDGSDAFRMRLAIPNRTGELSENHGGI